ncbi:Glycosyl Hydrolase Family 88 [Rhizoctonia solani]|uniref:Glycosyl Hydrolase Family 88 n=1 Tax=Rhizoctonia solani TaxID=456999 RepID=A0A8H7M4K3_9AGAM|nr:Glycosyl Hydrolase Family 88 [Rhizoctonia solani]
MAHGSGKKQTGGPAASCQDLSTFWRNAKQWFDSASRGNAQEHDQGFLAIPYLEELKINLTNVSAIAGVKNFAVLLANRYNDSNQRMQLLFKAADLSGNQTLIDMAISHANKTIANHVCPNGSSYQVVVYNEIQAQSSDITLTRATRKTAPGHEVKLGVYMDSPKVRNYSEHIMQTIYKSCVIVFNLTNQPHYLDAAQRMAKVFLSRLPSDGIPPYDFDAPLLIGQLIPLLPLSLLKAVYIGRSQSLCKDYYKEQGVKLLVHNFKFALQPTWDSILSNGTSNARRNNTNTGLVYGDYYAIQAGNTMLKLGLALC